MKKVHSEQRQVSEKHEPERIKMGIVPSNEICVESACGPAPDPEKCEWCGKTLYYSGLVIGDHVSRWLPVPERCTCKKAVANWERIDAEERSKKAIEAQEEERVIHRQKVQELLTYSGLRKRFRGRTFDAFKAESNGQKKALTAAMLYADSFPASLENGEGLYIQGPNGTGKTHLAAAIGLALTEKEYAVIMKTSFDLLEGIKRAFDNPRVPDNKVLKWYVECDLLIIDDLGKEQSTEWSLTMLYKIINERYEEMKPIIITSNITPGDLAEVLTPKGSGPQKVEAIISRLKETTRTLTMDWEDYRGRWS